jgi:hypothetical protein
MKYDLSKLSQELRAQCEASPLFNSFPDNLLSVGADAKTSKGTKLGYRTAILYLSPYNISGVNLCAGAKAANCFTACLYTAGRGAMSSVHLARLRKTLFFLQYPELFKALLRADIRRFSRKCMKDGATPLVRLNGTQDIQWEKFDPELFDDFFDIQFYDYTKLPNRIVPSNYDLTFSYSGHPKFASVVRKATDRGMRQAVVFMRRADIPQAFNGMQCIDGDDTDVRHIEPQGVIVALYAKGKAKQDNSGFVVRTAVAA